MPEVTTASTASRRLLPIVTPGPAPAAPGNRGTRGLCAGENPEIFFPAHGDPGKKARETCAACPAREACLRYATEADEFGIWGGLDQHERQNLKRRQRRRQAAALFCLDQHGRTA